ncbi:MAG: PAS domain S-box protein [Candidatus Sericytochromatia bacterium]
MADADKSQAELIAELDALRAQLAEARREADMRVEEARRESESRYRMLAEATFEGVVVHELGRFLEANLPAAEMFGYPVETLCGMSVLDLAAPESRETVIERMVGGHTQPYEAVGMRRDGSRFPGELHAKVVTYQGRPVRVVAMRDLSERKRVEQALRQAEEKWRSLVASAPNLIMVADTTATIQFINRLPDGGDPTRVVGMSLYPFIAPELRDLVRQKLDEVAATGQAATYEAAGGKIGAGTTLWTQNTVGPLWHGGELVGYLIISTDITDLKRAEERLRKSEMLLTRAQEVAHIGSWDWEFESDEVAWSDELYRIYGYDPAEVQPSPQAFFNLLRPESRPITRKRLADAARTGQGFTAEFQLYRPDGQVRNVFSRTEVMPGQPVRMFGILQDVTELKQAYEAIAQRTAELRKAQELDNLKSNFVNAVTHELRTPLTSIKGYAEFLEDGIGGELTPEQMGFVRELEVGAQRLERLVDDLLDFARIEAGTFKLKVSDSDLSARIRETACSLDPQARAARLTLAVEVPEDPVTVPMDAERVGQVILNLLANAIKFTPPGGTITVAIHVDGDMVLCEVKDNGIGISEDDLPRLFQRFSQLESGVRSGGGTGLGLSISKTIVEAHGGTIGVQSAVGQGSTFWFSLPLRPPHVPEEHPDAAFEPAQASSPGA